MIKEKLNIQIPNYIKKIINKHKVVIPKSREEVFNLIYGESTDRIFEVAYDLGNDVRKTEAIVTRCKNGVAVNFEESYMRRRDPNCMVIADNKETDKETYQERFGEPFDEVREETFKWLENQDLILLPFMAGDKKYGYEALLIAPANAGIFAAMMTDLQHFVSLDMIEEQFEPKAIVFVAPPFRHTHFEGKQVVVHNRLDEVHEIFSYNLYPGPSAKKGIYSVLLNIGEKEGWATLHASAIEIFTKNNNKIGLMHEGASGGGKSEMGEVLPRTYSGEVLLGENIFTGRQTYTRIEEVCQIRQVVDDMAMCHPDIQSEDGRLAIIDGENGWFLRVDHIHEYGTAPYYEKLCIHPSQELIFLNIQAQPDSTCLIWEHTIDEETNKPCSNPRVIIPRHMLVDGEKDALKVDVRSFGVRVPPCTRLAPSYGILGLVHILTPELAWLWRLVSPRGYGNPSIIDEGGMKSEGVGSYWPFATGKKVEQANLLLEQILENTNTHYLLIPNQHIGVHKVGFMPQWIIREWLAQDIDLAEVKMKPSRCTLLGYQLEEMMVGKSSIPKEFLFVECQEEVGIEGYDKGAKILEEFFKENLSCYLTPDLNPIGRRIIEKFLGI